MSIIFLNGYNDLTYKDLQHSVNKWIDYVCIQFLAQLVNERRFFCAHIKILTDRMKQSNFFIYTWITG